MLPARFQQPDGFTWNSFTDAGGAKIRYGSLQPGGSLKGTIVLVTGFRETIEKYVEVMRDLTDRGFAVWAMDWHGQGGSARYLDNPQKMYSAGYDEHIATLYQFATTVVQKSAGPLILMAHSMGGHIGLRCLKEHAGVFDSAVFTSPMCDIQTPGFPRAVVRALVGTARLFHLLERYVPGARDWNESDAAFSGNKVTSDPERFAVTAKIYEANPELKMGHPTYGWIMHTFESIGVLQDEAYLRAIKTPILVGIAGNDQIVNIAAEERLCRLTPNCTRVYMPEAQHEIWMERDAIRQPWLERVSEFLEGRITRR